MGGDGWLNPGQRSFPQLTQFELCCWHSVSVSAWEHERRAVWCWHCVVLCAHAEEWLTEVMYDAVPLQPTLTETHGPSRSRNSGVWRLVAFCRINVKWNRNIKLILSALVLRYKVASWGFPTALINWKQLRAIPQRSLPGLLCTTVVFSIVPHIFIKSSNWCCTQSAARTTFPHPSNAFCLTPEPIFLISFRVLSHQSHPASLKLLIEAEGKQLLLALEKNE